MPQVIGQVMHLPNGTKPAKIQFYDVGLSTLVYKLDLDADLKFGGTVDAGQYYLYIVTPVQKWAGEPCPLVVPPGGALNVKVYAPWKDGFVPPV